MKVLLDECTPRVVKKRLPGMDIRTVQEMGWSGLKNGELLAAAEGEFDVFITTDKNLRHQQNLTGRSFAVLLLPSNQVPIVEALIPNVEAALATIRVGDFVEIPLPAK
jgi:predicted nuclease of predicted toxin-antitoxin system